MTAHVRVGARTGGALVILGGLVLFIELFLAGSVAVLFNPFPCANLGVILRFGGLEPAARMHGNHFDKEDRYVMLLIAGVFLWNMMDPPLSAAALMRQNGCDILGNHVPREASSMAQKISVLGIDIAKPVSHIVGMDDSGHVVLRQRMAPQFVSGSGAETRHVQLEGCRWQCGERFRCVYNYFAD